MTKTGKEILYKSLKHAAYFAACVAVFCLLWWIVVSAVKNEYVFPSMSQTLKEMGKLLKDEFFYKSYLASFLRTLRVFFLSFFCAAFFAVISYLYPVFSKILAPVVGILRSLPTMAVLLMILIWTTPADAPVVVGFLALFPILYTGTYAALSTVDKKFVDLCRVYKIPVYKRITKMYLPMSLPYILRECSAGLSFGVKLTVSAEIMASTYISIGSLMNKAGIYYQTAKLFALTVFVIFTGLLLESLGVLLARAVERRVQ